MVYSESFMRQVVGNIVFALAEAGLDSCCENIVALLPAGEY